MLIKAVLGLLLCHSLAVQADEPSDLRSKNIFLGAYEGEGVGPVHSRGYSATYTIVNTDSIWNSRIGIHHLRGSGTKSGSYVHPYRFISELTSVEYALEFCPVNKPNVQYCPFIPSLSLAQRKIGGLVKGALAQPLGVEGRTEATTLGIVVDMEQKLKFRYLAFGARFQGLFLPDSKLKTLDTFPAHATQRDKRISDEALEAIHNKNSVLSLRIYAGIVF